VTESDFLLAPVTEVRGIGPARAAALARLGIARIGDLIHHFPSRHDDLRRRGPVAAIAEGRPISLHGTIDSVARRRGRRGGWVATLLVDGERVELVWFGEERGAPALAPGWTGFATGAIRRYGGVQIAHPRLHATDDPEARPPGHNRLSPVYATTAGIDRGALSRWIARTLDDPRLSLDQPWPEGTLGRPEPRPVIAAYRGVHFPESEAERAVALRALGDLELFLFARRQKRRRALREARRAPRIEVDAEIDARIRRRFSFRFTSAQERAIAEVVADLARGHPMARLVQGEVGSGKTAVALYALLAVVASGRQGALLAPTAPLARQHHDSLAELLAGARVAPSLLIAGSDPAGELRRRLAAGEAPLVVGTHALLCRDVRFADLALAVVDEEQRFGIAQRRALAEKGEGVHRLHLSATPIPRTLALALSGDFDLSTLDELPPGRRPPRTREVAPGRLDDAVEFLAREIAAGHRVLFVVPRIEEEEDAPSRSPGGDEGGEAAEEVGLAPGEEGELERASVARLAAHLRAGPLGRFPVAELHGRLPVREQLARVARFRSGESPLLVATTLVEVGLDVPGLTVLWIEHADRFGLAQLHQLRGRLGRRGEESWCFFTVSPGAGGPALDRLAAFRDRTDGFALAEEDLRLRGEGETIGARQSGFLPFRLRHPREDLRGYDAVRRRAEAAPAEGPAALLCERLEPFFAPPGG